MKVLNLTPTVQVLEPNNVTMEIEEGEIFQPFMNPERTMGVSQIKIKVIIKERKCDVLKMLKRREFLSASNKPTIRRG